VVQPCKDSQYRRGEAERQHVRDSE
jgi:hypothetical protein